MKIVILGSGNVATHIALALYKAGEEVVQIYSRHLANAKQVAVQVSAAATDNLKDINDFADVYLISIKDDAIGSVLEHLKNTKGIIAHTSGSTSIDVFPGEIENYGVFYPLQTFSKERLISFSSVPICIEASSELNVNLLSSLASKLSSKVCHVNSEQRKHLHLAAVFAGNFSNHLYAIAADILAEDKLDFDLMRPLILETAEKVMGNLPFKVQTGPAIRRDEKTIENHLDLLKDSPEFLEVYSVMSESIKLKHK